mgnify:CR=1 FL=1
MRVIAGVLTIILLPVAVWIWGSMGLGYLDARYNVPTPTPISIPKSVEYGFPTPTATFTPQYVEFGLIQQYVMQMKGKYPKNAAGESCLGCNPPAIGSIKDGRCQGQTHDTQKFGINYGPSKYAYVLEFDGTLHICTEAGELIY